MRTTDVCLWVAPTSPGEQGRNEGRERAVKKEGQRERGDRAGDRDADCLSERLRWHQ